MAIALAPMVAQAQHDCACVRDTRDSVFQCGRVAVGIPCEAPTAEAMGCSGPTVLCWLVGGSAPVCYDLSEACNVACDMSGCDNPQGAPDSSCLDLVSSRVCAVSCDTLGASTCVQNILPMLGGVADAGADEDAGGTLPSDGGPSADAGIPEMDGGGSGGARDAGAAGVTGAFGGAGGCACRATSAPPARSAPRWMGFGLVAMLVLAWRRRR
ncbi:MAG: hypothetical protein AB7S26_39855 [Sandaracinaceae bacterium]